MDKAQICPFEVHPCCNTRRFRGKRSDVHLQDLTDIDFRLQRNS